MRINSVQKANKPQGKCGRCGKVIGKGDSYRWIKGRYGPRKVRCSNCRFRPSEMTSSDKLSRLYSAKECVEEAIGNDFDSTDDIASELQDAANEAREVAEEYRESADNIESCFGSRTSQCDEIEEKADQCESWADALEGIDLPEYDESQEEGLNEAEKEERKQEWREEVRALVQGELDSLEL